MKKAEKAYQNFSWELAATYLEGTDSNTCISPPGVYLLLSAIAAASDEKTKWELEEVLSGEADPGDMQGQAHLARIRWLNDILKGSTRENAPTDEPHERIRLRGFFDDAVPSGRSGPVLENQTSIKVPDEFTLLETYKRAMGTAFGDSLKIERGEGENLILENLINFRDQWRVKLLETERVFHTTPYAAPVSAVPRGRGNCVCDWIGVSAAQPAETEQENGPKIPFIYREDMPLAYCDHKDFLSAAIPFRNDYHMVLAMPRNRELSSCLGDAEFLEKALSLSPYSERPADLYLPPFSLNTGIDLKPLLMRMGIHEAFNEEASKITRMATHPTGNRLYIKKATQDTEVEVTAEGAAAKARTTFELTVATIGITEPQWTPPKKVIRFDHPFLFAIWQSRPTPIPLFIGTFQKPQET